LRETAAENRATDAAGAPLRTGVATKKILDHLASTRGQRKRQGALGRSRAT